MNAQMDRHETGAQKSPHEEPIGSPRSAKTWGGPVKQPQTTASSTGRPERADTTLELVNRPPKLQPRKLPPKAPKLNGKRQDEGDVESRGVPFVINRYESQPYKTSEKVTESGGENESSVSAQPTDNSDDASTETSASAAEVSEPPEEKAGKLAQNLTRQLAKRDQGTREIKSLRDAAKHYIKIRRIRNGVNELLQSSGLCETCKSLDLNINKFIVQARIELRKETKLYGRPGRIQPKEGAFEIGSGSPSCRIGTLLSIWKKSAFCSFCRLVIHSLREQVDTEWIEKLSEVLQSTSQEAKDFLAQKSPELSTECYSSWQIDGREHNNQSSIFKDTYQEKTRRIRIHWSPAVFQESYLVLVGGNTLPTVFLGRRAETRSTGQVNKDLINSWISTCSESHGENCRHTIGDRFVRMVRHAYFGVIDVAEMKLAKLEPEDKFVALSYTWGNLKSEPYKTTLNNVRASQAKGGIEKIFSALPRTIQDSIRLVKLLGYRYLWIDSLCIVQDSPKSWQLNSNVMDLVYGNAYFTICAADGSDAKSGLQAMSKRSFTQHIEEYRPEVRLMVSYLAEAYIRRSAWNSRAWTFQERLLSKRCLIFIENRIFFQCRSSTLREDVTAQESSGWSIDHANNPLQILDELPERAILVYMKSVELYTSRHLSRAEDILAAFKGIGNLVGIKLDANLVFGLPNSHFDWALLWVPQSAADPRVICKDGLLCDACGKEAHSGEMKAETISAERITEEMVHKTGTSKDQDSKKPFLQHVNTQDTTTAREEHSRKGSTVGEDTKDRKNQEMINTNDTNDQTNASEKPKILVTDHSLDVITKEVKTIVHTRSFPSWSWCGWTGSALEYKSAVILGCMDNLHSWLGEHTWIVWYIRDGHGDLRLVWDREQHDQQESMNRWHGYGFSKSNSTGPVDAYGRRIRPTWPTDKGKFFKTIPEYPFGIDIADSKDKPDNQFPDQRYLQFWTWSAYLRLTDHSLERHSKHAKQLGAHLKRYGIADYKGDWCGTIVLDQRRSKDFGHGAECEFIAVSEAKGFDPDEYNSWMYYIPKEKGQSEWDLFYVLLIEVKDEIAYRVGLGKVYKVAFDNSCREESGWKKFILG